MTEDALLTSLLHAVSGAPDDVPLRLHVAELLAAAQRVPEALQHVTHALTVDPGHAGAVALLQRLSAALARPVAATEPPAKPAFDWAQAEDQVRDIGHPVPSEESPAAVTEDIDGAERPTVRLADVGGMEHVKQRLELSFLGPIRNPQLASAFGATASGGLLLYGPPGCGKTFDEGLAVSAAAITATPDDERGHRIRALLLSASGRPQEALESGYRAVTLAPDSATAAMAYSMLLQRPGRLREAEQVAHRAIELAPQSADAHFQLADVTSDLGDRASARRAYAQTLALNPDHAAARHDLAVLDARAHRPGRALAGLIAAGRLEPTSSDVLRTVTAVCWELSWRARMLFLVGTIVTIGASDPGDEPAWGASWGARIAALGVLGVTGGLGWWTARPLPRGAWPVARAAILTDRPLTLTYLVLVVCALLFAAVAVSGHAVLATGVWLALMFLGLMTLAVRLLRRRARRNR